MEAQQQLTTDCIQSVSDSYNTILLHQPNKVRDQPRLDLSKCRIVDDDYSASAIDCFQVYML